MRVSPAECFPFGSSDTRFARSPFFQSSVSHIPEDTRHPEPHPELLPLSKSVLLLFVLLRTSYFLLPPKIFFQICSPVKHSLHSGDRNLCHLGIRLARRQALQHQARFTDQVDQFIVTFSRQADNFIRNARDHRNEKQTNHHPENRGMYPYK